MAFVNFKKGLLANIPTTRTEGTFYVTVDERSLYLDIDNNTRIRLGDFQEFETLEALQANPNPSTTALYYISSHNILAKFDGTEYVKINVDTGCTSFEVTGDGNVITSVSYDSTARKLTLTKGITAMTSGDVDTKIAAATGDLTYNETTYDTVKEYVDAKTSGIATDAALGDLQSDVSTLEGKVANLETAIGEGGSVETQIDNAIEELKLAETYEPIGASAEEAGKVQAALDEYKTANDAAVKSAADAAKAAQDDVDALEQVVGDVTEGKTVVEMIADAQAAATYNDTEVKADIAENAQAAADALAEAQAKVASVTAGDASVTVGGTATAPTVAAKLSQDADNALELAEDGLKVVIPAAAEYSIVKAENSGDYAAIYNLTKDGTVVGASINIPKDMVVESGSVVENPEGQAEGTYIKLVLQNVAEPLFINVGSLIEYVTSGSAADDMIVISISDDHKVTAAITDGSITLAKLSTEIQTAIGKAHSHENADVINSITADDVANWNGAQVAAEATAAAALSSAKTELEGKITAEAERAAAAEDVNAKAAAAAKSAADAAQADIDALEKVHADDKAALEKSISDGDAATLASAKEHATGLNTAMNTRVEALEAIDHDAYVAADAQVLTDAKDYADGLAGNYDAAGSAATAEANAKAHAETMLTWGEF